MVSIRRTVNDALISIVALMALVAVLASVNERVRHEVSARLATHRAQSEVAEVTATVNHIASDLFDLARDKSIEHAPLAIFVFAAGVLTVFMLRM